MIVLRLLPLILSFVLLAAHFSRADLLPLVVLSLAIPFLFFIKKRWVIRSIQVILNFGGLEWIRAMLQYIDLRKSIGEDWTRLAIILTVVALYTAASGLFLQHKKILQAYK